MGPQKTLTKTTEVEYQAVGQREPCPCGSGKKYKLCHGRSRPMVLTGRPFEGLPQESDWVALREIVPAATVALTLREAADPVLLSTVLPMAWAGLRRMDGLALVGLQTVGGSADPSRDVAAAVQGVLAAEPGTSIPRGDLISTATTPRLQDLVDPKAPFEVTMHTGFDFWLDQTQALDAAAKESLERANETVIPTARLTGVQAGYWCQIGDRTHLRWVLPQPEDQLVDAIARLHASGRSGLGPGTKYIGSFRAHGLLAPVWDLVPGTTADDIEGPAAEFEQRLAQALLETDPLTYEQRRAKAGVVNRQLTLR